jgi:hypothetical protein
MGRLVDELPANAASPEKNQSAGKLIFQKVIREARWTAFLETL